MQSLCDDTSTSPVLDCHYHSDGMLVIVHQYRSSQHHGGCIQLTYKNLKIKFTSSYFNSVSESLVAKASARHLTPASPIFSKPTLRNNNYQR